MHTSSRELSDSPFFRLAWTNHGKCLDITDGLVYSGARPQVWTCFDYNSNQVWDAYENPFEPTGTSIPAYESTSPATTDSNGSGSQPTTAPGTQTTTPAAPYSSVYTVTSTTTIVGPDFTTTETVTSTTTATGPATTTPTVPVTFNEQADTIDGGQLN